MSKTAIVIGATGVTGRPLVDALLEHNAYQKVLVFSRRDLQIDHAKLVVQVVDFDDIDSWAAEIVGDELFSAMGTTMKQAGSKQAQYKVDFSYQANVIAAAAQNGVPRLFLVSSPSASSRSLLFYPRIKGELEDFAAEQTISQRVVFRPSLIVGDRPDGRLGEKLAVQMVNMVPDVLFLKKRYQPITGEQLAQAMVNSANTDIGDQHRIYELEQIFKLL
ncbi:MAG: NAD(P)H-binding protein [Pseudomonadota bacterium]